MYLSSSLVSESTSVVYLCVQRTTRASSDNVDELFAPHTHGVLSHRPFKLRFICEWYQFFVPFCLGCCVCVLRGLPLRSLVHHHHHISLLSLVSSYVCYTHRQPQKARGKSTRAFLSFLGSWELFAFLLLQAEVDLTWFFGRSWRKKR